LKSTGDPGSPKRLLDSAAQTSVTAASRLWNISLVGSPGHASAVDAMLTSSLLALLIVWNSFFEKLTRSAAISAVSLSGTVRIVPRPHLHRQIKERLHDGRHDAADIHILTVQGLGGSGKSQLVLNYVQEYREDYSTIFWIEAGQKESMNLV
jgi:hypothetical protein